MLLIRSKEQQGCKDETGADQCTIPVPLVGIEALGRNRVAPKVIFSEDGHTAGDDVTTGKVVSFDLAGDRHLASDIRH